MDVWCNEKYKTTISVIMRIINYILNRVKINVINMKTDGYSELKVTHIRNNLT